jgi:AcrR family transcriptional regulator
MNERFISEAHMADSRLYSIYFHAGRLFHTKRYANTKVSEIAKAAGIATGTVYNLFASKKAILTFVIRASLDKEYLNGEIELPIAETDMRLLLELYTHTMDRAYRILRVKDSGGAIVKSFPQMIAELFDFLADVLLGTNNIEHNADSLRELSDVFFPAVKAFYQTLEDALCVYMQSGEVRQLDHLPLHRQSIVDIVTWWAMNAYIAMPEISLPQETAREIAVDLVSRAYLMDG